MLRKIARWLSLPGIILAMGCNVDGDHSSHVAISGVVWQGASVGVPGILIGLGQVDFSCSNIRHREGFDPITQTDSTGEFTVGRSYFLGPVGQGCAELLLELAPDQQVSDSSVLLVPVRFYTSTPRDTAWVTVELSEADGERSGPVP